MNTDNGTHAEAVHQAVVLAAGKGERLYPLTSLRPKVMLPIGNKPILEYVIEALVANDVRDIVMVIGYQRDKVQDYFGSGQRFGANIRYVVQQQQLGTGHALLAAQEIVDDRFLVVPGDNVVTASTIRELVFSTSDTILVTDQAQGHQYGVVSVTDGLATTLVEKPHEQVSPWINTGAYLLTGRIFDHLGEELELPGAINEMIANGRLVTARQTKGAWRDAVYPWDLLTLNSLALGEMDGEFKGECEPGTVVKGPVFMAETSIIRANSYVVGPVVIGEGCELGPGVSIFPYTSIGNNVVIESFTELRNCIIGNSVHIASHSHLSDTILAEGCTVGPRFTSPGGRAVMRAESEGAHMGTVIADNVSIGANVSIRPGTLVGQGAQIREMNALREDVPEMSYVV